MIRGGIINCLALGLLACSANEAESNGSEEKRAAPVSTAAPSLVPDLPESDLDLTDFSRLLNEYRRMNDRLDRVSAPLRLANAALCQKTFRDPGFHAHSLEDYPEELRQVAQNLMGVEPEAIYVRSVRRGSPADEADIQVGDRVLRLNGQAVPGGTTMRRFYSALSQRAFGGRDTKLTLRSPEGQEYQTRLQSATACDYPTQVFYSQDINGHTDGRDIYITSELMRVVPDDVNLALIVAHEMAHAMAGHIEQTPRQELELEADRMALVLMARAGYDIDVAISYWADAVHPHRRLQDNSDSHPAINERYENFRQEQARLKELKRAGKDYEFK